jgi:hypothetical protein
MLLGLTAAEPTPLYTYNGYINNATQNEWLIHLARQAADTSTIFTRVFTQIGTVASISYWLLQVIKTLFCLIKKLPVSWIQLQMNIYLASPFFHRVIPILGMICCVLSLLVETISFCRQILFHKDLEYKKEPNTNDITQTLTNVSKYSKNTLHKILPRRIFQKVFTEKNYLNDLITNINSKNPTKKEEALELYKVLHNYNIKKTVYHFLGILSGAIAIASFALAFTFIPMSSIAVIIIFTMSIVLPILHFIILKSVVENERGGIALSKCIPACIKEFFKKKTAIDCAESERRWPQKTPEFYPFNKNPSHIKLQTKN